MAWPTTCIYIAVKKPSGEPPCGDSYGSRRWMTVDAAFPGSSGLFI